MPAMRAVRVGRGQQSRRRRRPPPCRWGSSPRVPGGAKTPGEASEIEPKLPPWFEFRRGRKAASTGPEPTVAAQLAGDPTATPTFNPALAADDAQSPAPNALRPPGRGRKRGGHASARRASRNPDHGDTPLTTDGTLDRLSKSCCHGGQARSVRQHTGTPGRP